MRNRNLLAVSLVAALGMGMGVATAQKAMDSTKTTQTSKAAELNAPAPDFTLTDLNGKTVSLSELTKQGKIVVLEWFNPECPVVVRHYTADTMNKTYNQFKDQNVAWVRINSGAEGMQGAGVEKNKAASTGWKITGPVLIDETGKVGKMYDAKTTPHMYVIDKQGMLVYAGAIDNDPRGAKSGATDYVNYVQQALEEVIAGETVSTNMTQAYGCSVKYGK